MYEILIKNSTIIDGAKNNKFKADIAVSEERIKKIGNLGTTKAELIINADNLYASPGFIDINNHSDTYLTLFTIPSLESLLKQGITTILGGNCGSSLAPLVSADILKTIQKWADIREINLNWLTFKEFLEELSKKKIGINFASLVGHSTMRRGILKDEFRNLKPKEMKMVKELLKSALQEGAFGLSTGLVYSHAKIAPTKEIIELAKIVKDFDGLYTSHIRGEAEELLPAVEETIEIGKKTKVSVEISHLKAMGRKYWPNMAKAIELIEEADRKKININFDIYPYTITGSVLYILLPDWVAEGGKAMLLKRLKDPGIKSRVIKEMQERKDYEYDKITIAMSPIDKSFIGRRITEIAKSQDISVEEAIINMLIASEGRVIIFLDTLNPENVQTGLIHSLSFIASDGAGYNLQYYLNKRELVHPRCFGAFPRFLGKYVRDKELMSWEEAIYKITGGPAQKLGLKDRGLIKTNYWADLVLFDPKKIIDKATFENPYQYSGGIEYVFVNGKMVIEKGIYNGEKAGRVLKKS
ncbi:MAG: N-acyl-D-amino-acid deacylase family protein [Patescibacteria group bacterium]